MTTLSLQTLAISVRGTRGPQVGDLVLLVLTLECHPLLDEPYTAGKSRKVTQELPNHVWHFV